MPSTGALIRNRIWPSLFWLWVAGVSGWIHFASVREVEIPAATTKYSNIHFIQMQFEQIYSGNTLLSVESHDAQFDSETKQLRMSEPRLQWKKGEEGVLYTAQGKIGKVTTEITTDTALPADFRYLELGEGVHIEGKNSSVDSTRSMFDNKTQLFYFPESSTMHWEGMEMKHKGGMVYNPLMKKLETLR